AEDNPDPLEGERANRGVVSLLRLNLRLVVCACPCRFDNGMRRILVECLAEEVGARPAEMHPLLFTTALGHRRYAGQRLQVSSRSIAVPLCTERPRSAAGPTPA